MTSSSPRCSSLLVAARALVVTSVTAMALLVGVVPAQAVTTHRALNDTRPVGSAGVTVSFPIEYFGVVADLPPGKHLPDLGAAPYGEVRFRTDGHWGVWQAMDQDGAQASGHFTGALVSVDRADGYQVRGLPALGFDWRAAAINTSDGPTVVVGHRPAGTAQAAETGYPACMSRADWRADESITAWSGGTDTQVFYPDQVITAHHTAGSNDLNEDYAATVRAIYSYHVQTNRWSDIGYQYLIDGHGTVYEGRNSGHTSTSCLTGGGDGSDFAHRTSDDYVVTGAHVGGWNSGNLGVALMGCYEVSNACSGDTTPPAAAENSLEQLVASLSSRHRLDPTGSARYVSPVNGSAKTVATVSGHRDWEATACPGGNLYSDLPRIRTAAKSLMAPAVPPAQPTGLAVSNVTSSTAHLSWTPSSDATAWRVQRKLSTASTWSDVGTTATPSYDDGALAASTSYDWQVIATSAAGESVPSSVVGATTPAVPSYVERTAVGEYTTAGTVQGTYVATQVGGDGAKESITEVSSGGKPSQRYATLAQRWDVDVAAGPSVTFYVDATATTESFDFAWSTDDVAYHPMLSVTPTSASGAKSFVLPASTNGRVYVRATDADHTAGNKTAGTLTVDWLAFRSGTGAGPSSTLTAPGPLTAKGGDRSIGLTWSAGSGQIGYQIDRLQGDCPTTAEAPWMTVARVTPDATSWTDTTVTPSTRYAYRVAAYDSSGATSASGCASAVPTGITLSATGSKRQGQNVTDVSWQGSSTVVIYRDRVVVKEGATGSSWTDTTVPTGGGSYTYRVCSTSACSNEATVAF